MAELIRQRDEGDWTFLTVRRPNGGLKLLLRRHPVLSDGTEGEARSLVASLSPMEVRALIACLDILDDEPG